MYSFLCPPSHTLPAVGLGAMQGESRKRKVRSESHLNFSFIASYFFYVEKASTQRTKGRNKRSRQTKILNTHLDSELLKDYSEDGQIKKQKQ